MNLKLWTCVFCCYWPLATAQIIETDDAAMESAPAASSPSAERKAMELLVKFQNPESVIWLKAEGEEFLGLYQPALRGKAKGGVLLLHAEGQHPDWPGSLAHLRRRLAEWGWNTLSISLPDPNPPKPPASTDASNETPALGEVLDETEEVFDPVTDTVGDGSVVPNASQKPKEMEGRAENIAVERIVAGIAHLNGKSNGKIVLYGQGLGALRASHYWQETADNSIGAIIFVDARNGLPNSDFTLPQSLTNPRMPILDVVQAHSTLMEIDAKQRAEQAAINDLKAFQQQQFAEDPERLSTTIYGFLRRHSK